MKMFALKPLFDKSIASVGIICLCALSAIAQTPVKKTSVKPAALKTSVTAGASKPTAAPKSVPAIIDAFFKKYKDKGADTAIDYLFSTNKLLAGLPQLSVLKTKLDSLPQSAGKYVGHELIVQKSTSPSLFFYSYLVKFENQPYRFTFMFYKPQNEWELYRFKYDDQIDSELEEAGKINNKHP